MKTLKNMKKILPHKSYSSHIGCFGKILLTFRNDACTPGAFTVRHCTAVHDRTPLNFSVNN